LFDLDEGLKQLGLDGNKVIGCFEHYLKPEGHGTSRADAEQRMLRRLDGSLTEDVDPLLRPACDSARTMQSRRSGCGPGASCTLQSTVRDKWY
jgi:hypothetical protein